MLELAKLVSNSCYKGDYYLAQFDCLRISQAAQPGQFVHLKIEGLQHRILRRPFSICDADGNIIKILYKIVGEGTKFLSELKPGTLCSMMGPCGRGFSAEKNKRPVLICGGYGAAATFMLAKKAPEGILLAGARNEKELVLIEEYEKLRYKVFISTDDGSLGEKAYVTGLLEKFIEDNKDNLGQYSFHACGPEAMIKAAAKILLTKGLDGQMSLDHKMCCGVGACLACVLKVKTSSGGWRYARTCTEGPVFNASELYFD